LLLTLPVLLLWLTVGPLAIAPATELVWTDLSGHDQTLESLRGRIVVLNFWATWCAPCREEMPDLVRIQNRYGMYGVQVIGASADPPSASDSVVEFARHLKINFPVLLGATTEQMQALGAGVVLPATVVIDREGQVVERISGVFDPPKLEALLDRLVAQTHAAGDEDDAHVDVASADPHDHGEEEGREHDHPPPDGTSASLVPS